MNLPPSMFTKTRSENMLSSAVRIPLTGCCFALTLGWLWFPVLRNILLPGLFTGWSTFNPLALGLALSAGCFLYAPLCDLLEGGTARQRVLNAVLAHGLPLLLLCLLLLLRNNGISLAALDSTLAGFAVALPGVWWVRRLLPSGPEKAVAVLAWAAFAALAFSLPLSMRRLDSTDTVCILVAGLAMACLAALFLIAGENEGGGEGDARSATAAPLETSYGFARFRWRYAVLLCGVAPIFFSLGSLNVLIHETGETVPAIARICALIAAVFFMNGSLERVFGIAACVLAVLALCMVFFSTLACMLLPVGTGLLEAACIAMCAVALRRGTLGRGAEAAMAGLFIVIILAAGNSGYLAGWKLASFAGKAWPVMPGLAAALLLATVAYQGRKSGAEGAPARDGAGQSAAERQSPPASAAPDEAAPVAATINPPITGPLTKREQALAFLLVNGYTNKAAAESLGLKDNTLRWHIKNLHRKTGAIEREDLIMALKKLIAVRE